MKIKSLVLVALASIGFAAHAGSNLIADGSFESQAVSNGHWGVYNSAAWNLNGLEIRNNVAGVAQDGKNFVELDVHANQSIFQNIQTDLGKKYDLSFWYATRPDGKGAASNTIVASWNNSALITLANTSTTWTKYSFQVTGTGNLDNLKFSAGGISDSYGGSLDNVTLTAAVPEPETYAMLLAGLGLMGGIARRRNQAK